MTKLEKRGIKYWFFIVLLAAGAFFVSFGLFNNADFSFGAFLVVLAIGWMFVGGVNDSANNDRDKLCADLRAAERTISEQRAELKALDAKPIKPRMQLEKHK